MNDIEKLELLQFAAQSINFEYDYLSWNPLENDKDAFDLLVKLQLRLEYFSIMTENVNEKKLCTISFVPGGEKNRISEIIYDIGKDDKEITRRLIVRTAAEIGKRM